MFEMLLRKLGDWVRRPGRGDDLDASPESRTLGQRINPMYALEDSLRRVVDHLQRRTDESATRATEQARQQLEQSWPALVKEVEEATNRAADRATTHMAETLAQQITRADGMLRDHREQAERQAIRIVLVAATMLLVVGASLLVLSYVLFT